MKKTSNTKNVAALNNLSDCFLFISRFGKKYRLLYFNTLNCNSIYLFFFFAFVWIKAWFSSLLSAAVGILFFAVYFFVL